MNVKDLGACPAKAVAQDAFKKGPKTRSAVS